MATVFIFNSPAGSGKDFACEHLKQVFPESQHLMFKQSLYSEAAKAACIPVEDMVEVATNRVTKECYDERLGMSPRKWLIHVSENIIKPLYGKDYFGKCVARSIDKPLVFISDGGFLEEMQALSEHTLYIIQLEREGCSFAGDSRRYITEKEAEMIGARILRIKNNGDEQFLLDVQNIVGKHALHIDGVNILNPHPDSFSLERIANSLSKICRYSGNIDCFYSVAQHSLVLVALCERLNLPLSVQRYALLHDAAEAFLQDVPRPVKKLLPEYEEIDERFNNAICRRYNVSPSNVVAYLDLHIVHDEISVLKARQPAWKACYKSLDAEKFILPLLTHEEAKEKFMEKAVELFPEKFISYF